MQNAKDTFYMALRGRLAELNPARTMVVRGAVRPGIVVEENELPSAGTSTDAFVLQWTALKVDPHGPMPLAAMSCDIRYATDGAIARTTAGTTAGTTGNGGMDRGRMLGEMDAELVQAIEPRSAMKMNYAETPAAAMATRVFWSDVVFGAVKAVGERLTRTATVLVFAYQEAGEL